jgi:hypothetical protein
LAGCWISGTHPVLLNPVPHRGTQKRWTHYDIATFNPAAAGKKQTS